MVTERLETHRFSSNTGWAMTIPDVLWQRLYAHLFPGDEDEHGAIILAGQAAGRNRLRLLVRDVLLARDGKDYGPSERGYRALHPLFIAAAARRARDEGWVYLAVHCHGGSNHVSFSAIDLASHERGYPALMQLTGHPVGGVVLARNAIAGDLWLTDRSRVPLNTATVIGTNLKTLTPQPRVRASKGFELHDRQARLFGADGQQRLESMRVGIVGLGGAGSMAAEMLARLGVGELVFIDHDRIESSNLSRVVGSRRADLRPIMTNRWIPSHLRRVGERRRTLKVHVAKRAIREAGLPVNVQLLPIDVIERQAARALTLCDWIVLSADTQLARHLVNAVVHAYLIPAVQVGVKVPVDPATGVVGDVFTVSRRLTPSSGCLWCNGLVDATALQLEALGDEGGRARAYVGVDAPNPSVITLNGLAVSTAMTDLLLASTGLLIDASDVAAPAPGYVRDSVRTGRHFRDEPRRDHTCRYCGDGPDSMLSRGDDAVLPIRLDRTSTNVRDSTREEGVNV